MRTRKLVFLALLTAAALVIFTAEAQIPPVVPVPGIKLGLSNIIIMTVLCLYGPREAAAVMLVKILLGSAFSSAPSAVIYSTAGGVLSLAVMTPLRRVLREDQVWGLSAFGAMAHNIGQLAAAMAVLRSPGLGWYLPVLLLSGAVTGVFTGLCARPVIPRLRKIVNSTKK